MTTVPVVSEDPSWHKVASDRVISEYHAAGLWFDRLHQSLLPHLRAHRRSDAALRDYERLLHHLQRSGLQDYQPGPVSWPYLVIDATVMVSYARLDNQSVGAALVDALADEDGRIIASPLAYLLIAPALTGRDRRRLDALLNQPSDAALAEDQRIVTVPKVAFDNCKDLVHAGLDADQDVAHTALLALPHGCVIGTLDPDAYHRIGYTRTVNLSEGKASADTT